MSPAEHCTRTTRLITWENSEPPRFGEELPDPAMLFPLIVSRTILMPVAFGAKLHPPDTCQRPDFGTVYRSVLVTVLCPLSLSLSSVLNSSAVKVVLLSDCAAVLRMKNVGTLVADCRAAMFEFCVPSTASIRASSVSTSRASACIWLGPFGGSDRAGYGM